MAKQSIFRPSILLAEDNEDDVFFARFALDKAGILSPLFPVRDGLEAIHYLQGAGQYADRSTYPLPSVLILDLKMPRSNGFEVLAWARSQPKFHDLPIVVLSSSASESDIRQAKELGATSFKIKPLGLHHVVVLFQEIHERWLAPPARGTITSLPQSTAAVSLVRSHP